MNRLYETIKKIKGIDYRYWGIGNYLRIIGPKSEPNKIKENNVMKLLDYLDRNEYEDLKLYQEDRDTLVKSLSEDKQKEYEKKRTAELQTRRRRLETIPEIEEIAKMSHNTLSKAAVASPISREQFDERLKKIKKKKTGESEEGIGKS